MYELHRDGNPCCYFHPGEVVVGVCALCLRERLLVLASKQGDAPLPRNASRQRSFREVALKSSTINVIPKVFALGSFLHRPESWRRRRDFYDSDDREDSFASLDDSFISIKFDDGRASWDKKSAANSHQKSSLPVDCKGSVVEHHGGLRWRKRIGHLFQVLRWKRYSKANSCHKAAEAAAKGRRGWIRRLTRRRTTAAVELPVEDRC